MYAIDAQVETAATSDGGIWRGTRQVPTFYLDERVQGITSRGQAVRIAMRILDPLGTIPAERLHITAVKVTDPS